jgi:hypothetical protein
LDLIFYRTFFYNFRTVISPGRILTQASWIMCATQFADVKRTRKR